MLLDLDWHGIGKGGAKALRHFLVSTKTPKTLWCLSHNHIDEEGLKATCNTIMNGSVRLTSIFSGTRTALLKEDVPVALWPNVLAKATMATGLNGDSLGGSQCRVFLFT